MFVARAVATFTRDTRIGEPRLPVLRLAVVAGFESGRVAVQTFVIGGTSEIRPEKRVIWSYQALFRFVVVHPLAPAGHMKVHGQHLPRTVVHDSDRVLHALAAKDPLHRKVVEFS